MRISPAQQVVLRLGAVMCLAAAAILAVVAIFVDTSGSTAADLTVAADPTAVELPDPGLFASSVTVYGHASAAEPGRVRSSLGCKLLSRSGHEQGVSRMSELRVIGAAPVVVDGEKLDPLFAVTKYTEGSVLSCDHAQDAAPFAVSAPSLFGRAGGMVRAAAVGLAIPSAIIGIGILLALRRRRA